MDGAQGDYTDQNKAKSERQLLDDLIHMWIKNKASEQNKNDFLKSMVVSILKWE